MIVYVTTETAAVIEYMTANAMRPWCVRSNQRARSATRRILGAEAGHGLG
jgi:hypothetical protein